MALKVTIVALALSSVDAFAPLVTGASRRPAFCNNPSDRGRCQSCNTDARARVSPNKLRATTSRRRRRESLQQSATITQARAAPPPPRSGPQGLGILAGCAADRLFTEGTWNADFHESMIPQAGDLVVEGKKGLDAFPGTNLESLLKAFESAVIAVLSALGPAMMIRVAKATMTPSAWRPPSCPKRR